MNRISCGSNLALTAIVLFLVQTSATGQIYYHPTPGQWLHFDYWSRCKDQRIEPGRRIGYCRSMLGGGHGNDGDVLTQIGIAYMEEHKYDLAKDSFNSAMSWYSDDAFALARDKLDETLVLTGHYDLAMADLDKEIKLRPKWSGPYNERCWLRAVAGKDLDAALADCNQALAIAPHSADIFDSRGLVNFKLGKLKEAAADYDSALEFDPKLQSSLFMRGVIKLRNEDTAGGKADIATAADRELLISDTFASYGVTP